VRNAPIETLELRGPVVVEQRRLRVDSGGPGRWRGGLGLDVTVRNLVPGMWRAFRDGRRQCPPWGLWGGRDGAPADFLLSRDGASELVTVDGFSHHVDAGSRVVIRAAGGGGWGDPHDRDPALVRRDVEAGLVSAEAAEREYGVAVG
jgi:N-methylhydantoinase B